MRNSRAFKSSRDTKRILAGLVLIAASFYTIYSYSVALFAFTPPVKQGSYSSFPPIIAPTLPTVEEIEELSLEEAVELIDGLQTSDVAEIFPELDPFLAGNILAQLSNLKMIVILEKMVVNGETSYVAEMLNNMPIEIAGDLLLNLEPELMTSLLELMADNNLTEAARRLEEAIKQSKFAGKLGSFTSTLEHIDMDILVDLFEEITRLPATPSTVASVFEVMSMPKVLEIVSVWIDQETFEPLEKIFIELSNETLSNIFLNLNTALRNLLYPNLDENTQERLPNLGTFELSNLKINPKTGPVGTEFEISVEVSNIGFGWGKYFVNFTLNEFLIEDKKLTIAPNGSKVLSWLICPETEDEYRIKVNTLTETFNVISLEDTIEPAYFVYRQLDIDPLITKVGETSSVSVILENIGDKPGTELVQLFVDDKLIDTKNITLEGGEYQFVIFSDILTFETPGIYIVKIRELSRAYLVEEGNEFNSAYRTNLMKIGFILAILVIIIIIIWRRGYNIRDFINKLSEKYQKIKDNYTKDMINNTLKTAISTHISFKI